ncbi:nicotinate-nucleotide adenylyltransferase [Gillisia sp. Q332]|uniref:nicotinate-nucleotide adenylyltransferase n=1 Tax=Gillisia xinjiangensis TaxID=3384765 RepID=UPI003919B74A
MKRILTGLLIFGLTIQSYAQITELPEIEIVGVNYKYLDAAGEVDVAEPVKMLQRRAATFDLKNSEYYQDEYDTYFISFFIPEGKILASYNKDGKLLRTAEKFKDIALPKAVAEAVAKRFPGWTIAEDVYLVNYHEAKGASKKYKLLLENGDKRMRVKTDEKGNFL